MDTDVTIYRPVDLSKAPPGLTMVTAHAVMAAMAEGIDYIGDRSPGDVLFEAVCGLAAHPDVVGALHREVGHPVPACADGSRHHDFAGHPRCPGCGWDGVVAPRFTS